MFDTVLSTFQTFISQFRDILVNFDPIWDTLDILLVTFIIYCILLQLRKSQSIHVIKGFLVLAVIYGVSVLVGLKTSSYIFSSLFSNFILVLVIIFSYEIRQTLENAGKAEIPHRFFFSSSAERNQSEAIRAVVRACVSMSEKNIGSLIIFQRNSLLGDLMKNSVPFDGYVTYETLCAIFYPNAPLHDGAIVIRGDRIVATRCVVPIRNEYEIDAHVGTRHKAALNACIDSDAVAVVTSEETGMISVAVDGQMKRGLTEDELLEMLQSLLIKEPVKHSFFGKGKKNV